MEGSSQSQTPTTSARIDSLTRQRSMHFALLQWLCWAVMFGVGECYFSLFATHVHAPKFFFGLLTGIPALMGPVSQMFGADVVDTTLKRKRLVLISVLLQSLCYAPLAYLPFLGRGQTTLTLFLTVVLLYFIGGHFCVPAWNSWISVLVPAEERSTYFARISRAHGMLSLTTKLAVAVAFYLASRETPDIENAAVMVIFAVAFAIAGIARFGSYVYIRKMYEPPYEVPPDSVFTFWQFIRRTRESNFVKFVIFVSLVYFGTLIAGPFFLPYAVYTLKFEQWQWVVLESFGGIASVATLLFWGSFSHRFGNKRTLKYTSAIISMIPLLWLFSVNFYFLIFVNILSGMAWAGFNLSAFNYILEAVSPAKRARCVAYYNLLVGIGSFSGSMLGGYLIDALPSTLTLGTWSITVASPFVFLLVLSASTRLLMSIFFGSAFTELRKVEPFELKDLVFYISEARSPVGLRFGAIANPPEKPESAAGDETPP